MKKKMTAKKIQLFILGGLIVFLMVAAIIAPLIAPNDPYLVNMGNILKPPGGEYPLGTDDLGRCIFTRILYGAKTSIFSSLIVVLVVFVAGTLIGISSAFIGGVYESVVMRIITIFQAFPGFILAMAIAGMLGTGLRNGILSLCLVYWTSYARVARSLTLEMRGKDYIRSAQISGAGSFRIMVRHIFPNITAPLLVMAALDVGGVVLALAGLSFVGLSGQRPTAEWGLMMNDSRQYLQIAPWTVIFPGIALLILVILFNLFADTLRDVLDVKKINKSEMKRSLRWARKLRKQQA